MRGKSTVLVWDPFVRVFHWSLVLAYTLAWASAEEFGSLHEKAGYFILGLLGLRVAWGVIGSRHARFNNFVRSPVRALDYLRSLARPGPDRYLGHNPAAGWMIIALILSLAGCALSGVFMTGHDDFLEALHEGLANLSLLLIVVHLAGVLMSSMAHRENLLVSMLTGRKAAEAPNEPTQ